MPSTRMAVGLLLSLAIANGAEAQGGLIKRKLGDALKKKVDPAQKTEAASDAPKFPFVFNDASMASFKRGLELEIRLRDEYRAQLAKLKTPNQYADCKQQAVLSDEGMKLGQEYVKTLESVKGQDDMAKAASAMAKKMDALVLKQCGADPTPFIQSQQDVFTKAERAGAVEFAKGWTRTSGSDEPAEGSDDFGAPSEVGGGDHDLAPASGDEAPSAAFFTPTSCGGRSLSRASATVSPADSSDDDDWYRKIKELIEKYCSLPPEQHTQAQTNGIKVAGSGTGINWVFTSDFARWIGDLCQWFLSEFAKLQ